MSQSDRLRAGVIGLGWAGQQHMAGYAAAADVDLVALAGMEPDGLQQLGDKYDVSQQQRYADWHFTYPHDLVLAPPDAAGGAPGLKPKGAN